MLLNALGFARYATTLTPVGGCPRCNGPIITGSCMCCGYAGPTHVAQPGEWVGRPVQTSKRGRTNRLRTEPRRIAREARRG